MRHHAVAPFIYIIQHVLLVHMVKMINVFQEDVLWPATELLSVVVVQS